MQHLTVGTENTKGNARVTLENKSLVITTLNHDSDYIKVDGFESYGANFKQREISEITICKNDVILFQGTKYELYEQLNK
jgi:hypothetical protein